MNQRRGASVEQFKTINEQGQAPQNGDLCGGTGGNGQIVSIGENLFTMKRKDGKEQNIKLTDQAEINTPKGSGSLSDLKKGNRITLVGGQNADGSFTADAIFVCSSTNSKIQSGQ